MTSCLRFTASVSVIVRLPTKTRRRFTQKKKEEVRLHYSISGSYCETARTFDINELTVRGMIDARPLPDKINLSIKYNFPGTGRPLTYPNELLKWIFVLRNLHFFAVLVMSFQEKTKLVRKFFNRHKLALRVRTSFSQKLPKQLEGVLSKFYEDAASFMRIGKYPLSLVGNLDETPAFCDMVQSIYTSKKGERKCMVRYSGSGKNI